MPGRSQAKRSGGLSAYLPYGSTFPYAAPGHTFGEPVMVVVDVLFLGVFFGVLIAVGLYHLLMYALLRNRELLAYAIYVGALIAEEIVRTRSLPLAGLPFIRTETSSLTFAFLAVASFWFFTSFLQMRERAQRSYRLIRALTALVVVLSLGLGPVGRGWATTTIQLLSLVTLFAVFVVAVDQIRKGDRAARYFIIAFSGVSGGSALYVIGKLLFPQSPVVAVGFELGTAFEAIALALGIADRIRTANEERDLAQQRIIDETRSLNVAYARFVPHAFLELLGKSDIRDVELGEATQRDMTVLFSDIRSFTMISEKMTPRENFDFLNAYLQRVGPLVRWHQGVVDKYIGDAIMALFANRAHGADDALQCAIALQREVAAPGPSIKVGVGLHTGPLMLGTIGEPERMDGTVIADAVNLASRVEGLTKMYGASILLTEQTRDRLEEPSRFALRFLGRVAVKGKDRGVGLFEACDAEPASLLEVKVRLAADFAAAVDAFGAGKFDEAHAAFAAVLARNPVDGPAAYLGKRCEALLTSAEAWDGVDRLAIK